MKALYGLYVDAAGAQRAFDLLRSASSELKLRSQQIVVVAGEPHEGYEFLMRKPLQLLTVGRCWVRPWVAQLAIC